MDSWKITPILHVAIVKRKTFLTRVYNINLCKSASHQNDHPVIFGALAIIKKLNRSAGTGAEWLGAARVQIRDGRCEIWAVMLHVDVALGSSYAKFYDIDVHVVAWLCLNWAVCCLIVSWMQGLAGHYQDSVSEVFHVNLFINISIMFSLVKV